MGQHRAGDSTPAATSGTSTRRGYVDTDSVIALALLVLRFGRVERITLHEDGATRESDTDHTVMLGLVACAFAANHLPDLDPGLVGQYALVHDLVEAYVGDTPTLRITPEERVHKANREHAAYERISREFWRLPWLAGTIAEYETLITPEARYVRAMDKLLPKVTHILNCGATLRMQGISREELRSRYAEQLTEITAYAADFPPLLALRAELIGWLEDAVALSPQEPEDVAPSGPTVAS